LVTRHPSITQPMGSAEVALHQAQADATALAAVTQPD
jgi:hypothetical protein